MGLLGASLFPEQWGESSILHPQAYFSLAYPEHRLHNTGFKAKYFICFLWMSELIMALRLGHGDAGEGSPSVPRPAEARGCSLLLSGCPNEDVVARPVGKKMPISVPSAEVQGSQPGWVSLGSPGGFPVAGQGVNLLPQKPGGLQDLLPIVPSKALAHEDSCGVWGSGGC